MIDHLVKLFGSLINSLELMREVLPSLFHSWCLIPLFAIVKVHATVVDEGEGIVENLHIGIWVFPNGGTFLCLLTLCNQHLKRGAWVPFFF